MNRAPKRNVEVDSLDGTTDRVRSALSRAVVVALGGMIALVGCEKRADQANWQANLDALAARSSGSAALAEVRNKLTSVATSDGHPFAVTAHASIGHAELAAAGDAERDCREALTAVRRVVMRLSQEAAHVRQTLDAADAIVAGDPTTQAAAIAKFASEGRGDGNRDAFPLPGGLTVASVNSLNQEVSTLTGEAAELDQEIATKQKRIGQLFTQADEAQQLAGTVSGDDRVAAIAAAAQARTDAAKLQADVDRVSARVNRLKSDAAVRTASATALDRGVKTLSDQANGLRAGFVEMQKHDASLRESARNRISGAGDSIVALIEQLGKLQANADEKLVAAVGHYEAAAKAFADAKGVSMSMAQNFVATSGQSTEGYQPMLDALSASQFDLYASDARTGIGRLHEALGSELLDRRAVAAEIANLATRAGVSLPASMSADAVEKLLTGAITSADESLNEASNHLQDVAGAARNDAIRQQAAVARAYTSLTAARVSRLAGQANVLPAIAQKESNHINDAKLAVEDAKGLQMSESLFPASLRGGAAKVAGDAAPIFAEVKSTLRRINSVAETGDASVVEGLIAWGDAQQAAAPMSQFLAAFGKFAKATDDRFGAGSATTALAKVAGSPMQVPAVLTEEQIESAQIVQDGEGRVTVTVEGVPTPLNLVLEESVWKLDVFSGSPMPPQMMAMVAPALAGAAPKIDEVTAGVLADQFTNPDDAVKAMMEAVTSAMQPPQ